MSASYPTPARRTALIPSIIAVIALLAGVALIESDGFIVIRYIVSIFALIVAVFGWQARQWWWIGPLAAIAVLNMDDAGDVAPAAAMAMLIFFTSAVVRTVYMAVTQGYLARSQAWRRR